MSQVQYQSVRDLEKVRNFFIKYQDRLLYGTDLTLNPGEDACGIQAVPRTTSGRADWRYLATDESQRVEIIKADVRGLRAAARGHRQDLLRQRAARLRVELSALGALHVHAELLDRLRRFPRARPCR